jgi:CRISPR-associated protein Cas4
MMPGDTRKLGVPDGSLDPASEPNDPPSPARRAKPLRPGPAADLASTLIPARMINEVLYCERLMYLEWVQGEWADNAFTADGQAVHRRVNEQEKPLAEAPDETSDGEQLRPYVARSASLSSERLGITAKLDLVEVDGGAVVPVEYKRGSQPDVPAGAYLPELAQVCAQVLLLREHGYQCSHGEIYYAKDRKRLPIVIDETLVEQTLGAV